MDDYIRTKASYAESIMNKGDIMHAIEKFENAKSSIENEIVYENPLMYINICNQLGNCYLQNEPVSLHRALDNFEFSLCMISKLESEDRMGEVNSDQISSALVSKVCMNIALIRSELGHFEESVYMHQKCLIYKEKLTPILSDEMRD